MAAEDDSEAMVYSPQATSVFYLPLFLTKTSNSRCEQPVCASPLVPIDPHADNFANVNGARRSFCEGERDEHLMRVYDKLKAAGGVPKWECWMICWDRQMSL